MYEISFVVAIIVALGQLVKNYIPVKYMPLIALGLGIVAGVFVLPHETIQEAIMNGIAAGLSASGLFDLSKVVTKKGDKPSA